MNNWIIFDNNGIIEQGEQSHVQLVWDLTTRHISDLQNEYRGTYTSGQLKVKKSDLEIKEWTGDLRLAEINEHHK
jgi:hypothetical protein